MTKALGGLVAGLATVFVALVAAPSLTAEFWQFLGRFHPTVVHLPIGILLLAIGFDLARGPTGAKVREATPVLLLLGAWSAIVAAVAGVVLANWGGYPPGTLFWHRTVGLAVAVLAVVAYALRTRAGAPNDGARVWYPATAALLGLGLVVGGHLGGTLTHGAGYLTDHLPSGIRPVAGLPPKSGLGLLAVGNLDSASVFDALIQPILTQRCGSCHNPDRKKGGLSLASLADLLAGGKDGKVVVPGRSTESEITKRLWLPPGHKDRMPPDRSIPMAEAELIRWWIDQGAPNDAKLAEVEQPAGIRKVLDSYGLDDIPTGIFTLRVAAADSAAITAARKSGLRIEPVAANSPFLEVASTGPVAADALDLLGALGPQIAWVDLHGTAADDSTVSRLAAFPHLARINLRDTRVTDRGLESLRDLQYLEYLNLYGVAVTDSGIRTLAGLGRLRSLFLSGTKVTAAGADSLGRILPRLQINLGTVPSAETARAR